MENSVVGDLINFRGLVYAPINENGVIFLFGKIVEDLNMYIEEIKPGFPDCIARRFVGKGWKRVRIEFEYQSKNFVQHKHNPIDCDIIVCWEHDWSDCPVEVIELKSEIRNLENYPIKRPVDEKGISIKGNLDEYYLGKSINSNIKQLYNELEIRYVEIDESVWQKYGKKYIGWYSPEKSFASFLISKMSIMLECFCGDTPIDGTKISNEKYAPRWCKISLKSQEQIEKAIEILKVSQKRIVAAIKKGQTTGYFSGGMPFGQGENVSDKEETNSDS